MQAFLDALNAAIDDALTSLGHVIAMIPTLLVAILVVLFFARLAQTAVALLDRPGRLSPHLDPSLKILIRQCISVGVIVFGIAIGFGLLGLNLAAIAATFGVAGLIVGFALKDMLENFIAGVIILWRRPFEIGQRIKVGDEAGIVCDIGFRTTTLQTVDGIEVLIPNSLVFNKALYNYSHYGYNQETVVFTVPARADLSAVRAHALQRVTSIPGVLDEPRPEILLLGETAAGYELHVQFWVGTDAQDAIRVESAIRTAIVELLAELVPPAPTVPAPPPGPTALPDSPTTVAASVRGPDKQTP
jgi:small-conductance mechanosensitive channel